MKVVLFVGAGASAELGVPAMRSMAESYLAHLRDAGYQTAVLGALERLLQASDYDMENVLDDLDSAGKGAIASERWGVTTSPEAGQFAALRAEAEWLISHLCERVDAQRANLLWRSVLKVEQPGDLVVATTNYDRAIEQAALKVGVSIDDGFPAFAGQELVPWAGFGEVVGTRLFKVHGSTDWYHEPADARVWKLRHAMPLFGNVRIAVEGSEISLGSALVLPSREKKVTSPPYPDLAFQFRKAVEGADLVVFVGCSLRDPDLLDLAQHSAARMPTMVVSRSPRSDGPGQTVAMSASRFLISIAPQMLSLATAKEAIAVAVESSGKTAPILDPYATAFDTVAAADDRCTAIETLAAERVSLSSADVDTLLRDEADSVATFALGLVADCHGPDLVAVVTELVEERPGSTFAREAAFLAPSPA